MSLPNHFQPWKANRSLAVPPSMSTNNNYGKLPAAAQQSLQATLQQQQQQQVLLSPGGVSGVIPPVVQLAAASSTSAISSSTGAAGVGALGGMSDFLAQLGANKLMLSKLSASYGLAAGLPAVSPEQAGAGGGVQHSPQVLHVNQHNISMDECVNDKERELRIQQIFENAIGDTSKKQIVEILEKISILRPPERLLLYLRMPGGYPETDPLRQSQNPLGTRSEINHTINWVRSHLEHDPNVSIPKQEVYDDYTAYCERIDIKPLSTADFGKVMKQVFPGIRPRRLGTRGHSRYCYAAMRKATKLAAPKLPDLTTVSTGEKPEPEDHVPTDEEAWKVIKVWAEAMYPSSFGSINELASYITKNNLNSPSSIASRQQLQKKLLQREIKERKKLTAAALKKRRRKRRKTLSTSVDSEVASSGQLASPPSVASSSQLLLRTANNAQQTTSTNSSIPGPGSTVSATSKFAPPASSTDVLERAIKRERQECTEEEANGESNAAIKQQQSTNLNCDTSSGTLVMPTSIAGREIRSPAEYNIFCKKVRQAQQLKAAAQSSTQHPHTLPSPLRPLSAAAKRAASMAHLTRQRRIRMLQQQQQRSIEAQNNSAPRYDELGNLILIESQDLVTSSKEDFIIPRERVISICNMDKNALDDYLNCEEENSQDQDQELLQYFPEENADAPIATGMGSCVGSSSGIPLEHNGGFAGMYDDNDTNVKLSQLRSMLEQNMGQCGIDKPQVDTPAEGFDGTTSTQALNLQPGSAAASLAMLSQRHHGNTTSSLDSGPSCSNGKKSFNNMKLSLDGFNNLTNGSSNALGNSHTPLQSPNGRCKNYSFVPISAGPQSPRIALPKAGHHNITPNASPFVSPRNTPIHRKHKTVNNGLSLSILHHNQQLPGYNQRPSYIKNELPASAPPSPSLAQNYRFSMNPNAINCPNTLPSFQPICGPSSQMQPHPSLTNSLESRSSSVPLIPNYESFNHSSFTSMSQTPVPSECDDFSDNILDILREPAVSSNNIQQQPIKLEDSEPIISDILGQDEIFPKSSVSYNNLSRSVPSTPLPHHMSFNQANSNCSSTLRSSGGTSSKSLFELPKSVPSTPITLNSNNRESLFQYSPETSRDFLINGNSVERTGKLPPFYPNQSTNGSNNGSANVTSSVSTGTANSVVPSSSSGTAPQEMSILNEGIESLTDDLIGSDTLQYL